MMDEHSVCIAEFEAVWMANRAVEVLADAGVEAVVDNALLLGTADPHLVRMDEAARVLVLEPDEARARKVLEDQQEAIAAAPPAVQEAGEGLACLSCGVAMAEEDERCAACGWTYLENAEP